MSIIVEVKMSNHPCTLPMAIAMIDVKNSLSCYVGQQGQVNSVCLLFCIKVSLMVGFETVCTFWTKYKRISYQFAKNLPPIHQVAVAAALEKRISLIEKRQLVMVHFCYINKTLNAFIITTKNMFQNQNFRVEKDEQLAVCQIESTYIYIIGTSASEE